MTLPLKMPCPVQCGGSKSCFRYGAGDAMLLAFVGAPSNFFCTARPMKAKSDIWAPLLPTRGDILAAGKSAGCGAKRRRNQSARRASTIFGDKTHACLPIVRLVLFIPFPPQISIVVRCLALEKPFLRYLADETAR